MNIIDLAILALYFLGMIAIGAVHSRRSSSSVRSYFLGNNQGKWWMLAASGVSSNFDAAGTMFLVSGLRGGISRLLDAVELVLLQRRVPDVVHGHVDTTYRRDYGRRVDEDPFWRRSGRPHGAHRGRHSHGDLSDLQHWLCLYWVEVDSLVPLATAEIPIIAVYGEADVDLPPDENILLLESRYRAFGGEITVIAKSGVGHHPHSLADPAPLLDFILSRINRD